MSAPLIFLAIDVATIVCATLLGVRVLVSRPRLRTAQLIGLIAFSVACGVILGHQEYGYWMPAAFRIDVGGWTPFLNLTRNLAPGLFMLLCFALFTEEQRFPQWLLFLLLIQLMLEEPGRAIVPAVWRYSRIATQTAPALLQTLFGAFAVYWTLADWRFDLVERRRRIRALILAISAVLSIAFGLLTRVLINPDSPDSYMAHVALTLAELMITVVVLLQLTNGDVGGYLDFEPAKPSSRARSSPTGCEPDLDPSLARLTTLLEDERVCQQEGLSLRELADRVDLPEYRLRKLIHERLGYRNFNALLHDYRIREACRQLSDPGLRRTPILTIALSVGYASVNTFNRGFREIMGVTPSAYREAELAARGTPKRE